MASFQGFKVSFKVTVEGEEKCPVIFTLGALTCVFKSFLVMIHKKTISLLSASLIFTLIRKLFLKNLEQFCSSSSSPLKRSCFQKMLEIALFSTLVSLFLSVLPKSILSMRTKFPSLVLYALLIPRKVCSLLQLQPPLLPLFQVLEASRRRTLLEPYMDT